MDERDRCRGALVGLAVGDAIGMPAEELTPQQVRLEWGALEGFEAAPAGQPCAHLAPGQWTDDTQLALLLAESLCAGVGAFDVDEFGLRLAEWFNQQRDREHWRFPGTACLEAAGRLAAGVSAKESGVDGAGCGAAMRVAPAGVAFRHHPAERAEVAVAQARVTHTHPLAIEGAVAVADAVGRLCAGEGIAAAVDAHRAFLARPEVALTPAELTARAGRPLAEIYAPRGPSGWTAHAVPAAIQAVVSHPDDFKAAVLDAANAGGDTDSVAAMAGAMSGAALGWSAIPVAWREQVEAATYLVEVADRLFEAGA